MIGKRAVPIATVVYAAGVHAGDKTRPARRTDRTLALGMRKGGSSMHQRIQRRRLHIGIAQGADGIKPLLIRAVPKYIGACVHGISLLM